MKILNLRYKAHRLVNIIFYLIIFIVGFVFGYSSKNLKLENLISNILMIDSVSAYTIYENDYHVVNEEYIYNAFFKDTDYSYEDYPYILCNISNNQLICKAFQNIDNVKVSDVSSSKFSYQEQLPFLKLNITFSTSSNSITKSLISSNSASGISASFGNVYTNFDFINGSSLSTVNEKVNKLDLSNYTIKLDAQVDTWNGRGYDYYTNQVGIIDMRKDTYIINSHTCPNDGDFVSGYTGDTNDICFWSYYSDLSDYLVFYFNARNYDSENVEWSNITFLQGRTYTLSFTLYGLVNAETLSSIQFSLEGALTQEIFSTSFTKVLRESMDEKTYLTFSITPTEDIEMDHFFLKFNSNGSYAQTVGANRLWTYKDYTGVSLDEIQIEKTDKILMTNEQLKDLINNPLVNSESVDNFWNEFKHRDYGLTQIITAPINTIKKISNSYCTPYNITILGKTIQMPCGDDIFWNREDVQSFRTFWNMFWGGLVCYGIGRLIVKDVHKATSPNSDKLEVIDL